MYLGNKTLCDYCNSKTMKKRHKKVDKEVQAQVIAAAASSGEQQPHEGSGNDHNETHVEEKSHATESREGEF